MAITLREICNALSLSKARVDQWISRGHFRAPSEALLGKARDWDYAEALRLAIMSQLVAQGVPAEIAGRAAFHGPTCHFVVAWRSTNPTPLRCESDADDDALQAFQAELGQWFTDHVDEADLLKLVKHRDVFSLTCVATLSIAERVQAAFRDARLEV